MSDKLNIAIAGATGTDLSNYYTKAEVDTAIGNVSVDLSGYYTKTETDALIPDVSGFATETYVDTAVAGVDFSDYYTKTETDGLIPDVSGFATETYVDTAVGNVDLTDYYTKTEIDNAGFLTSFALGDGDSLDFGDDADLKLYFDGSIGVQTSFLESDALIIRSKTNQDAR